VAVSYFAEMALQAGTALSWPGGVQSSDLAVAFMVDKLSTTAPTTATDWKLLGWGQAVGTGSDGVDTGLVRLTAWYTILTSSSPAAPDFTLTGGNASLVHGLVFRKAIGDSWDTPVLTIANRTTSSTTYAATSPTMLGAMAGDFLAAFSGVTRNSAITSGRSLTLTGLTGTYTNVTANGTNNGNHLYAWTDTYQVTSGVESTAPVANAVFGAAQSGGTAFLRVGINRTIGTKQWAPSATAAVMDRAWKTEAPTLVNRSANVKVDGMFLDPTTGQIWPRGNR
jgi:hypothetical protein